MLWGSITKNMKCFYSYNNLHMPLEGIYKNQTCFLVLSGPSLNEINTGKLDRYGIMTMGVNNSPAIYRPKLWLSVDSPCNFMLSIWLDPTIKKFTMCGKKDKPLWDNVAWEWSKKKVGDCPNMVYYNDNEHFNVDKYLHEDTLNWGNHTDRCCGCGEMRKERQIKACVNCGGTKFGSRSVMLAAIKALYVLGFSKVFLIGADFRMNNGSNNYAWDQNRTKGSISSNNSTYEHLNNRFDALRPLFENEGFFVFNSTPNSGLKSFPYINFDDAIDIASHDFPIINKISAYGMYEREAYNKDVEKWEKKIDATKKEIAKCNGNIKESSRFKKNLDKFNKRLNDVLTKKKELEEWTRV